MCLSRDWQTLHDSTSGVEKNAPSDLCVIVNALVVLEDNGLKNNHPLSIPLPSTDPIKFYIQDSHKYLPNFPGSCVIALGRQLPLPTVLATYCLLLFLYPCDILDFGAPNPGRLHIACSWRRVGQHLGGIPLALEGQSCRPRRVGVAEARLGPPRRLPGASAAEMSGC